MITKINADQRHYTDFGSLKTYWLFSFSNYYDPKNMHFGALRVFNDDIIMPGAGFPDHPHDTMEIVSIVHSGTLTHRDSLGNAVTITAGEVQRMSAGKGIVHSEFNNHNEPVHLYQLWFHPNTTTKSDYEQKKIIIQETGFTTLASGDASEGLTVFADATISHLNLDTGQNKELIIKNGYGCFVYVENGTLNINGTIFEKGDQARITDESLLTFSASNAAQALVIEVGRV